MNSKDTKRIPGLPDNLPQRDRDLILAGAQAAFEVSAAVAEQGKLGLLAVPFRDGSLMERLKVDQASLPPAASLPAASLKDAEFLEEAARHFEKEARRSGEDRAHWAGVYNAENLRRIAQGIRSMDAAPVHFQALQAIRARINGEWDHPALVAIGPLATDQDEDILNIIEQAISGQPDTAAPAAAAKTQVGIRPFLDLSTSHLREKTLDDLMAESVVPDFAKAAVTGKVRPTVFSHVEYGCIIYVPGPDSIENYALSDDLRAVLDYAASVGADYVMFDRDGLIIDNLPVYDWDAEMEPEQSAGTPPGP